MSKFNCDPVEPDKIEYLVAIQIGYNNVFYSFKGMYSNKNGYFELIKPDLELSNSLTKAIYDKFINALCYEGKIPILLDTTNGYSTIAFVKIDYKTYELVSMFETYLLNKGRHKLDSIDLVSEHIIEKLQLFTHLSNKKYDELHTILKELIVIDEL